MFIDRKVMSVQRHDFLHLATRLHNASNIRVRYFLGAENRSIDYTYEYNLANVCRKNGFTSLNTLLGALRTNIR